MRFAGQFGEQCREVLVWRCVVQRFSWPETNELLGTVRSLLQVQPNTVETHLTGIGLAERYGLSVYDAMIAAAALQADCDTLWSEDMQDGLVINGRVRVTNPF